MPWSDPRSPSIQLGCLKAYVDRIHSKQTDVFNYSAFLSIIARLDQDWLNTFSQYVIYGEYLYFLLYYQRFLYKSSNRFKSVPPSRLRKLIAQELFDIYKCRYQGGRISSTFLRKLDQATVQYVEKEIVPNLIRDGMNVVGFTMNYSQVYSSIFVASLLQQKHPEFSFLFLFGGYSASTQTVVELFQQLKIPGCFVLGEGERKLESIIEVLLRSNSMQSENLVESIRSSIEGVLPLTETIHLYHKHPDHFSSQLHDISALPLPDFHEYVDTLNRACDTDPVTFREFKNRHVVLFLEGSRGCFASCDFCGFNDSWTGFRKNSHDRILSDMANLAKRYSINKIWFADNVCDTWAEKFAEQLMADQARYHIGMQMRAHHQESCWAKLAMAGVAYVQVGVETLSAPLLKHMAKGTKIIQNLVAQKCLRELGIESGANLLTFHPRSTVADVLETKRVLSLIPHLDGFRLSPFVLTSGSPLYNNLDLEEKKTLLSYTSIRAPKMIRPYLFERGYFSPKSLRLAPEVYRAWQRFTAWYEKKVEQENQLDLKLEVSRSCSDVLRIYDTRFGKNEETYLEGDTASIYDLCHQGMRMDFLEQRLKLPQDKIRDIVDELVERKILLKSEDYYLSIALRPRDELISNLYRDQRFKKSTDYLTTDIGRKSDASYV